MQDRDTRRVFRRRKLCMSKRGQRGSYITAALDFAAKRAILSPPIVYSPLSSWLISTWLLVTSCVKGWRLGACIRQDIHTTGQAHGITPLYRPVWPRESLHGCFVLLPEFCRDDRLEEFISTSSVRLPEPPPSKISPLIYNHLDPHEPASRVGPRTT